MKKRIANSLNNYINEQQTSLNEKRHIKEKIVNKDKLFEYLQTEYEFDDRKIMNRLYEGLINNVYKYLRDEGLMQHKSEVDEYLRESINK